MVSAKKFDSLRTWPCSGKLRQKYTFKEGRSVGSFLSCPHWNYRVGISFPEFGVD